MEKGSRFMVVRIRWNSRPGGVSLVRTAALTMASLLMPSALIAFTLAFWRITADLHLTSDFFIASGLWSHWQVWLIGAAVLVVLARLLDRYARADDWQAD
jgi:hypothetical protein